MDRRPRVALVNDYEVVVAGLAAMFAPFQDRIQVLDALTIDETIDDPVDVVLYDSFGREGLGLAQLADLLARPEVTRVAVYSFACDEDVVRRVLAAGASGYLSKTTPADVLADQIICLAKGDKVVADLGAPPRITRDRRGWPGRELGLSERESEVVGLAAVGRRNSEIADSLYVSVDTVKTHLARSFRKLEVHNRTELAALVLRHESFRKLTRTPG